MFSWMTQATATSSAPPSASPSGPGMPTEMVAPKSITHLTSNLPEGAALEPAPTPALVLVPALPGHGKDLDEVGYDLGGPLPTGVYLMRLNEPETLLPLLEVKEFAMLRFMNTITDKPNWDVDILKPDILRGWMIDAKYSNDCKDLTERMVNWCFEELKAKAHAFDRDLFGAISVYNGEVIKSDLAVTSETRVSLVEATKVLENVSAKEENWQPGSHHKVVNLVDPNRYPLVFGKTKILDVGAKELSLHNCIAESGRGSVIPVPDQYGMVDPSHPWSLDSQWLPCEVDIRSGSAKILSYINNLHPQHHANIYQRVEKVITAALPLWNRTLAPMVDINYEPRVRLCPRLETFWKDKSKQTPDKHAAMLAELNRHYTPVQPFDLSERFARLQVIVKMETIELTPSKPTFLGSRWHLDGILNEHIVATAVYDYDSKNITPSNVSFRQRWKSQELEDEMEEFLAEDGFSPNWYTTYRINMHAPRIQWVGQVEMQQGRLLSYPNIMQTKVEPFSLANFNAPGHRKILTLHLVDPTICIASTAHVPCQRFQWRREELAKGVVEPGHRQQAKVGLHRLPLELLDQVWHDLEVVEITEEETEKHRLTMMEERESLMKKHATVFETTQTSLERAYGLVA